MILLSVAGLHRLQQGGCHRLQRGTDKSAGSHAMRELSPAGKLPSCRCMAVRTDCAMSRALAPRALNDLQRDRGFALKQAAQCVGIGPYLDVDDVGSACGERLQRRAFVDIEIDMEPIDQTIVASDVTPPAT